MLLPYFLLAVLGPFDSYQPIIDTEPFGSMAAQATVEQTQTQLEVSKQKEEIAQKLRMCAVTITPQQKVCIGFIDDTTPPTQNYMLTVGETQNGFTLIAADYAKETATLEKDGVTLTLGLGKGLIETPTDTPATDAEPAATAVKKTAMKPILISSGGTSGSGATASRAKTPPAPGGFKARLLAREAEKKAASEAEKRKLQDKLAAATAEKMKLERRQQIERIKRGEAPTIQITLTPEEDAELERAGVFSAPPTPVEDSAEEPDTQEPETDVQ